MAVDVLWPIQRLAGNMMYCVFLSFFNSAAVFVTLQTGKGGGQKLAPL